MMRITARLFSVIDQFVDHSLADFRSRWGEIGAEFWFGGLEVWRFTGLQVYGFTTHFISPGLRLYAI